MGKTIQCKACRRQLDLTGYEPEDPFNDADGAFIICRCGAPNAADSLPADFKLSALLELPRDYRKSVPAHESIGKVKSAFEGNMDRVVSLARLPRMLGLHWEFFRSGAPFPTGTQTFAAGPEDGTPAWTFVRRDPVFDIDKMFATVSPAVYVAIETILSSMILGTWTAFETLAGDLWEEAINAHPAELAALRADEGRITKQANAVPSPDDSSRGRESKSVKLTVLDAITKGTFALHDKWGTILRQSTKFNFQKLSGIRAAYSAAFSRPVDEIDRALSSNDLDAINLVRNLIAHRGGVADQIYVDEIAVDRLRTAACG